MDTERDLEAAAAWVDNWQESLEQRAAQAKDLHERVQKLTAAGRDRSQTIEVTVTAGGDIADIWLSARVCRQPVADTRNQVLEAFAAARRELDRRVSQTATELLGNDNPIARAMLASLAGRTGSEAGVGDAPVR